MKSYNQAGQEEWVRTYLKDKKNGFFVDVGAYDGIESSNTYYLEHELGWDGICIESHPDYFSKLTQVRSVKCINKAAMPYKGHAIFKGIETFPAPGPQPGAVECDTLDAILTDMGSPKDIDYMSLDIEGHELSLLESFPFDKWNISLLTVEHNLYLIGDRFKTKIFEVMSSNGYNRVVEDVMCPTGPYEDWYSKIEVK